MSQATDFIAPTLRAVVESPELDGQAVPVDHLTRLSRSLQSVLQAIAEQIAGADQMLAMTSANARRAVRLEIAAIRSGSAVIDFDFVDRDQLATREIRERAIRTLFANVYPPRPG